MKTPDGGMRGPPTARSRRCRGWRWLLLAGFALALVPLWWTRELDRLAPQTSFKSRLRGLPQPPLPAQREPMPRPSPFPAIAATPEQVVAGKLAQFAQLRRDYAGALAQQHHVEVTADVERFFAAVESGKWDEIETAFAKISGGDSSAGGSDRRAPEVAAIWPAIIDAYGAAEQVHLWPAQKLLDYGNSVLDALRPGMVYVGGTDCGRWIPELLNDTSDGERHVVITQNALADGTYLDYLRLQYDDRLTNLSDEDSQRAFAAYAAEAQKRLEHDEQFPNEPKQVLPGEDLRLVDGKLQVAGQTSVMAINERLLQQLLQKNQDLSFAIQESFPLPSTYGAARPLGPLMELGARDEQQPFTALQAGESLDYWRHVSDQLLSGSDSTASPEVLKSYSHDTVAAANLLTANGFSAEAEQGYRLAGQIWPGNPESVNGLANLLESSGHRDQAQQVLDEFNQRYPEERGIVERLRVGRRIASNAH